MKSKTIFYVLQGTIKKLTRSAVFSIKSETIVWILMRNERLGWPGHRFSPRENCSLGFHAQLNVVVDKFSIKSRTIAFGF